MERVFGTWYENKFLDAGIKTVILLVAAYLIVMLYNGFGGKPILRLNDFIEFLWAPVLVLAAVSFVAFFYAGSAHRKYRHHLNQRAMHITQKMKEKKKAKR
jgi:hypothetical protein